MPVEKGAQLIVEDILKEAKERAAGIIQDAKKEARTLLDATRFGAREEGEREIKEARARGKRIYEEVLTEGRMRSKREILQRREELINGVLKEAEDKLRVYASSKEYEVDLTRLTVVACKKLGSDQVVIRASRRDLEFLRRIKGQVERELGGDRKEGVSVSFGEPIQTIGGVRVGTPDGKIEIDETFEGRMRREFEALRVKIAKVMFEGSR